MRVGLAPGWLMAGVVCLPIGRTADAQSLSPADRRGPFLAAGVGVGTTSPPLQCFADFHASDVTRDCGGLALTLEGGWLFSPRIGASLHVATSSPFGLRTGAVHGVTALTLQYRLSRRLWVRAGGGWGTRQDVTDSGLRRHLALVSAAGCELWRTRRPGRRGEGTLDVQLRAFTTGGPPGVRTHGLALSLGVALFHTRDVAGRDGS